MTLSGHSVEHAVQQVGIENQCLPYRTDVLLLTVRSLQWTLLLAIKVDRNSPPSDIKASKLIGTTRGCVDPGFLALLRRRIVP